MLKRTSFLVLMAIYFTLSVSCSKDDDDDDDSPKKKSPVCSITSPTEGQIFGINETITVFVDAEDSDGTIAEVRLFIDDAGVETKTEFPYNFEINKDGSLSKGEHTLRVVAEDNEGQTNYDTCKIKIKDNSFITFDDGIPNGWVISNGNSWKIYNGNGYDDLNCFISYNDGNIFYFDFTFGKSGTISFYGRGNFQKLKFYVDNEIVEYDIEYNSSYWKKYSFNVSEGTHRFKFENTEVYNYLYLDAMSLKEDE